MTPDGLQLEVVERSSLGAGGRREIVELCSDALSSDCRGLFGFLPDDSTHVRGLLNGRLVGHACWATRRLMSDGHDALTTAWIDTVVVAPDLQRRGVGTAVLRRIAEQTLGFELRALGTEQMSFFERLGWERWRGTTSDVLHDPLDTLMVLRSATTPADLDLGAPISGGY